MSLLELHSSSWPRNGCVFLYRKERTGGRMIRFVIGIVLGLVLAPLIVLGWLKVGHPPVAVADNQLPFERQIVNVPMRARIDSEMPKSSPMQPAAADFLAGAQIYRD